MSLDYYDDSLDSDNNMPQYARITFFGQIPYVMTKEKIIVGRNSAAGMVDIDVGSVSFVSRKHLEITYSYQKLKVKCLGKNGIFIDNAFKSHSCIPYELPPKCTLRFPSTDVQFCVEQLIGLKAQNKNRPMMISKNIRYFNDPDDSPEHKRIKLHQPTRHNTNNNSNNHHHHHHQNQHPDTDLSENDTNNEAVGSYHAFPEVICSLSDNDVDEFIHQSDSVRKLSVSDCEGIMVEGADDNEAVLMENIGGYSLDGHSLAIPKDFQLDGQLKSQNDLQKSVISSASHHNTGLLNQNNRVTKLVLGNFRCPSDQFLSNGRITAVLEQDDLTIEHGSDTQKPPYSYAQLIVQAVSTSRDRQLTLNGIYNYISKNYPYFKAHDKGWQNSVRHNLSLNRYFIKVPRGQDEPGKGSFWRVDPTYESKLMSQAFRKRRLRNNNSGIVTDSGGLHQVITTSQQTHHPQSHHSHNITAPNANSKILEVKSGQSLNRTSNFVTLKRACDIGNQNGSTTYMLSNQSGLSSNHDLPKYILTSGRNGASGSGAASSANTNNIDQLGTSAIYKYHGNTSKQVIIESGAGTLKSTSHNNTTNHSGGCTLISLGGRLFSTTNIKTIPSQNSTNSHNPFDTNPSDSSLLLESKPHSKLASNYYLISSNITKSTNNNSSLISHTKHNSSTSCFIDNYQVSSSSSQSPITISSNGTNNTASTGVINRRIISIPTHSPNIRKLDISNSSEGQMKPIIVKTLKLNHNSNFVTSINKTSTNNGNLNENSHQNKVILMSSTSATSTLNNVIPRHHQLHHDEDDDRLVRRTHDDDEDDDGTASQYIRELKQEDESGPRVVDEHQQFISEDGADELDTSCDMDNFLIGAGDGPHSDTGNDGADELGDLDDDDEDTGADQDHSLHNSHESKQMHNGTVDDDDDDTGSPTLFYEDETNNHRTWKSTSNTIASITSVPQNTSII